MLDSCFTGTAHFAPADSTITVSNDGGLSHSFTAVDGSFDTGEVQPGDTYELVVENPGLYEVFCTLHGTADGQGMAGVLIVGEAVPEAMSAAPDMAAIREAVAEGNQEIAVSVERQTNAIGNLSAAHATLRADIEEAGLAGEDAEEPVAIVTVPSEGGDDSISVLILSGFAVGLAAAALFAVMRRGSGAAPWDPFIGPVPGLGWQTSPTPEKARRVADPM